MTKLNSLLLADQVFQGKVFSFCYYSSPEKDFVSSIDLTLIDGERARVFRFFRPSKIEIDNRYSNHKLGLQIIDESDRQMEYVKLSVNGYLENVGIFSFWAETVIEISD